MIWKWLGALLLFPVQMVYLVVKAAVCMVLPPKLRDLSGENVLITGGGRGIGRHLAREFAKRGARKVRIALEGRGRAPTCCAAGESSDSKAFSITSRWDWWDRFGKVRGEKGRWFGKPLACCAIILTHISGVTHSSPVSCLSPSQLRKCEGEEGFPWWILLGWQRRGFRSSLGLPWQAEESCAIPMWEAGARLRFCLPGNFLAGLPVGLCTRAEGQRTAAPAFQAELIFKLSLGTARLSLPRMSPQRRGVTWQRAKGVCGRALALSPTNIFSWESEKFSFTPMVLHLWD